MELRDPARKASASFFWVGPRGTNTPLHHDTVMLFHAQIVGRKRWRFISPLDTPNDVIAPGYPKTRPARL